MELTPWTKRLIIAGLIAIPIVGMCIDVTTGRELGLLVVGGFLGMFKPED